MTKQEYRELLEAEVFTIKNDTPKHFLSSLYYRFWGLYLDPSHHAVYLIRKMQYLASQKGLFRNYRTLWIRNKLIHKYGMHISPHCRIGKGLRLPHPVGIVIGKCVVIGDNCSIYQYVTLGGARTGDVKRDNQPAIGDDVTIFAGAMILGKIHVDDNTIVAANSVLLKDTNGSGVYAGTPAKKVK